MAGERKQSFFIRELYKIKKKQMSVVNSEFGFFTTSEKNHSSKQWGKLYMSIEISHNVFDLNHNQMTKKFQTYNTLVFIYLMLLGQECVPKSWVS